LTAIKVKITYVTKQTNWTLIVFGILSCVYGFSNYYFLPLALVSFNIDLLLIVFLAILVGLLVGLALFTLNF